MRKHTLAQLAGSAGMGAAASWAMPADWFANVFLAVIGLAILGAVAAAVGAEPEPPLDSGAKILSYFIFGTAKPNATIQPSKGLRFFQLCAAFVIGMSVAVIWLAKSW